MSIVQQCNADAHADKLNLALGAYRTEVSPRIAAWPETRSVRNSRALGDRTYACRFKHNSHTLLQSHTAGRRSTATSAI